MDAFSRGCGGVVDCSPSSATVADMPPRLVEDQLEKWLDSETEYRQAVKVFVKTERSGPITRSDVLALVEVRARADRLRDHYVKLVLPARKR
jgi:hypothetical protein